jgi:hypothetical protein
MWKYFIHWNMIVAYLNINELGDVYLGRKLILRPVARTNYKHGQGRFASVLIIILRRPTDRTWHPVRRLFTRDRTARIINRVLLYCTYIRTTDHKQLSLQLPARDAIGCTNDACSQIIHAINMACGSVQITSLGIQMTIGLILTIIVMIMGYNAV